MFYRQGKIKISITAFLAALILAMALAGCSWGRDGEEDRPVEGTPEPTVAATTEITVTAETTELIEPTKSIEEAADSPAERTGTLWAPYLEWSVENPSFSGNPYDLVATVTFVHSSSDESRTTEMFYFPANFWDRINDRSLDYIRTYPTEQWASEYLQAARDHGSNTLFIALANQWLKAGALRHDEHDSVNPELLTFEMLESVIRTAHEQGGHLHIWMWGDEARKWTPIGLPGGINGEVDRRLQRYIAARLGPLPGWTMSYGFDLGERGWIEGDTATLDDWAQYLHQHMGWRHLLFTRGYAPAQVDGVSYSSNGPRSRAGAIQTSANGPASYAEVLADINSELERPHLYEERFYYMREFAGGPPWTMEKTRRVMWWNAMAGGVGAWWGLSHSIEAGPYPNPEQMATHYQFWANRFLLDMAPADGLSDGYVLKNQANTDYVFYKEDSSSIQMNLEGMAGPQPAVAVDTMKPYAEIDLGVLDASNQTWTAPYESDWAVAVGSGQ